MMHNEDAMNEEMINNTAEQETTLNEKNRFMKVPTVEQIRQCEAEAKLSSLELMENAAAACANWIKQRYLPDVHILVFCGTGNNGGDGLATARMLIEGGYRCSIYLVSFEVPYSIECSKQLLLLEERNIEVKKVKTRNDIPAFPQTPYVVIDALIGIGLSRPIKDVVLHDVIEKINRCGGFVFSVDTPSGMYSEQPMEEKQLAVRANFTLSFQFPKLAFFLNDNHRYVGEWAVADIGMYSRFHNHNKIQASHFMTEHSVVGRLIPQRKKFAHKGNFGNGLLIAGSNNMMGAAVLASKAALRTGIGLLTTAIPIHGYNILLIAASEALCHCDKNKFHFSGIDLTMLPKFNAVAIGCGLGVHPETIAGMKKLIDDYKGTIIFDADALNILSRHKEWLNLLPPNCILTPHSKEFERLTRKTDNNYERLELQRQFSIQHRCIVVLKGAHTSISTPQGEICFNTSGNQGMATGGSGDVLTGMLLALVTQGYTPIHAAIVGVYLHGLAADQALDNQSYESLLPSDIIENIGRGFKALKG